MKRLSATIIASTLLMSVGASFVFADTASATPNTPTGGGTYIALQPLPCIPGGNVTCAAGSSVGTAQQPFNFQTYLQLIFNLFIALAAAAAVFMIVFGGFQYMTTDSWNGKTAGLEKLKNALLGLVLVLSSYLILRTVDPRLVALPTTLVTPLNINYNSYQSLGALSNSVDAMSSAALASSQINASAAQTAQAAITNDQANASTALQNLQSALNANLPKGEGAITSDDAAAICSSNPPSSLQWALNNPQTAALCSTYNTATTQLQTDQQTFTVKTAQKSIDQALYNCEHSTQSQDACNAAITAAANGSTVQSVKDYTQLSQGEYNVVAGSLNLGTGQHTDAQIGGIIYSTYQQYIQNISDPNTQQQLVTAMANTLVSQTGADSTKMASCSTIAQINAGSCPYMQAFTSSAGIPFGSYGY